MPGSIAVRYEREPSYASGVGVQGHWSQTLVATDRGRVVGTGCRCVKPLYVDGKPRDFGYLSSLRIRPEAQGGTLLSRGYRFLRELHGDGRAPAYLSTVIADNWQARQLLTSGRAGLPRYADCGRYDTYCLLLRKPGAEREAGLGSAADVGLEPVLAFLAEQGPRRQFFPVLRKEDFGSDYLRGLAPKDILVAIDGQGIAGVLGVWDQRSFKQSVVAGYSRGMDWLRRFADPFLALLGYPTFTQVGSPVPIACAAMVCVRDDDPAVLSLLLRGARRRARAKGCTHLAIGFHEDDPLRQGLRGWLRVTYSARLYVVSFAPDEDGSGLRTDRVPYLELGGL